jgi:cyclopropane-fatty-acyl-phospholipid synthase
MRNWEALLARIATWLKLDGKLFIHIFTHKQFAYPFEVQGSGDWMAQYFFNGGMMTRDDLLSFFDKDLHVDGSHYPKTSEA